MTADPAPAARHPQRHSQPNPQMEERRLIAVDWSGQRDESGQRRHIWIADLDRGQVSLEGGRTRAEVCDWLIRQSRRLQHPAPQILVGLDFAFSYPEWFVRENGGSALAFWRRVAAGAGERWLRDCPTPFWGRGRNLSPPRKLWPARPLFRGTDRSLSIHGIQPKSPFQLNYPGAVGAGSLRGIPHLLRLRQAGFAIWPFDPPARCAAVEIYPRFFTGSVRKSNADCRRQYLLARRKQEDAYAQLAPGVLRAACASEDAFDALVSVMGMRNWMGPAGTLRQSRDPVVRREGAIWPPQPVGPAKRLPRRQLLD